MRTENVTFERMPQPVQQWQADAGAAAPAGEAPQVAEGVGTVVSGEATGASFDDAFAQLTAPEPGEAIVGATGAAAGADAAAGATDATGATGAAVPAEGGLPAVGADGRPVVTPPATGATGAAVPPAAAAASATGATGAAAPAVAAPPAPTGTELADMMRQLLAERQPAAGAPAHVEPEPAFRYTSEQQTAIDNFHRDFPEIAQAQELIRAGEYAAVTKYIFDQVAQVIQPLIAQTQQVSTVTHQQQLAQLVPDYREIVGPVKEWIGAQPSFLKAAYEKVATEGSAHEVAEMIGMWRTASGTAAPAAAAPVPAVAETAAPARAAAPAVPAVPARVAAALAPVPAKTGSVPQAGGDPNDFDRAFAEHAKNMTAQQRAA